MSRYDELAKRLGDGWAIDEKKGGVRKGMVRVWCYHMTTGRYGAQFDNCVYRTSSDAATPEEAVRKVLLDARRLARLTLEDIEKVQPGLTTEG